MPNRIDTVKAIESKLDGKVQIYPGKLGTAAIVADNGLHRDVFQTIMDIDEKVGITSITGMDLGDKLGIYYHVHATSDFLTIKSHVPKTSPQIKSLVDLHPGAAFHELEVSDLFGVVFKGNELTGHFILSDQWPEGVFPLRKDVNASEVTLNPPPKEVEKLPEDSKIVKIIIGPQHPALLEPEKFDILVEGEKVTKVEPRIGYVHRGIEKAAESRTYLQDVYLVERVCGICNACHACAFVETVEKILQFEVPKRAQYLRVVALELNRLHSHLLTLGHAGLEIGYETLFQYFWRDREPIMDLIELTSGNRVYSSLMVVGGVRRDIRDNDVPKIKTVLDDLLGKLPFYRKLYGEEPTLRARMANVGVLSREDAIQLSTVGPVARGSNYDIDVRKDDPYEVYGEIPFKEIVYDTCDTWARMNVRLDEVEQSIDIIKYCLDNMPKGPFRLDAPRNVPEGEAVNRIEAPRGELFYYVKGNGTAIPDRVKIRTPTFANIPAFLKSAIGENIADVPPNFVSLDPCFSCTDR